MAEKTQNEDFPLDKEEATRSTPKTGAEEHRNKRDRTSELPAAHANDDNRAKLEKANQTAAQTSETHVEEVQGKLAVPHAKVQRRGSTVWTDDDGRVHRELNDEEINADLGVEEATPLYLRLHQEVLDGADPIKASIEYQDKKDEEFDEATLKNAELHPRTGGDRPAEGNE